VGALLRTRHLALHGSKAASAIRIAFRTGGHIHISLWTPRGIGVDWKDMDSNDNHTTNDDLAVMIGKGFEHVEERFAAVDKRFDRVDERLDKLERGQQNLFEIVRDFSPKVQQKLEASVHDHEKRLKKLETRPA
jgi:hypothetical protein